MRLYTKQNDIYFHRVKHNLQKLSVDKNGEFFDFSAFLKDEKCPKYPCIYAKNQKNKMPCKPQNSPRRNEVKFFEKRKEKGSYGVAEFFLKNCG